eukprot:TRINITY_DN103258_c0_g1_i1.p1 TRINITY_DN103258_c0_g1~~TRINITY_DN103258_c0_g1_i1.p1  ORF type:complete len:276 (-),score=58.10 TRINITY_DN103258_c0_g1_i1:39-839(-)
MVMDVTPEALAAQLSSRAPDILHGVIKSFSWYKGWGFILHKEKGSAEEKEIFFHVSDFRRGIPEVQSMVTFELGECKTKPGTLAALNIHGTACAGSKQGIVKSFAPCTGWGFIVVDDKETFVHMREVKVGGLKPGDQVYLDLAPCIKEPDKMVAINVTGGSGHTDSGGTSEHSEVKGGSKGGKDWGKGKDKGKGKGKWDSYGPAQPGMEMLMAMAMMMMGGSCGSKGGSYGGKSGSFGGKGGSYGGQCGPYGGKGSHYGGNGKGKW